MRPDTTGMFWDDYVPPKIAKEKVKRTPPERVWERPDYLPHLDRARALKVNVMSPHELAEAARLRQPLIYDCEVYPNFFMVSFVNYKTGKAICFEQSQYSSVDCQLLHWVFTNCLLVGFNNLFYDSNIITLACHNPDPETLWEATKFMIQDGMRGEDVLRVYYNITEKPKRDEIDLIEVAPLSANLKTYGGRLHAPTIQDLPFMPGSYLTEDQCTIVRWYNLEGDIVDTAIMYRELKKQIDLRELMSKRYGVDLRSKSDAQLAEAVVRAEYKRMTNRYKIQVPEYPDGTIFYLREESYIRFKTPQLQNLYQQILTTPFEIQGGVVIAPPCLTDQLIPIGHQVYRMGIGGLHSTEKQQVCYSNNHGKLYDRDVASYYPRRILNVGMFPPQIGQIFLQIYNTLVDDRLKAKLAKLKDDAESLKIVVNGVFGKLLSVWSIVFAPHMGIQVTVGGQLCLLMLIESLELASISVVSANTDGVTSYVPNHLYDRYLAIVKEWEKIVGLQTDEKVYQALYSRDVNNYMAVEEGGKVKAKGAYLNAYKEPDLAIFRFHKNPVNIICLEALEAYLVHGIALEKTVRACTDIRKFVTVRTVKGGGVKNGEYLGKTVRWYYAQGETGEIIYAKSGNKVARTDGAKPCMELPETFPDDVDLDWYVREADSLLQDFGLPTTLENVPCMIP